MEYSGWESVRHSTCVIQTPRKWSSGWIYSILGISRESIQLTQCSFFVVVVLRYINSTIDVGLAFSERELVIWRYLF